MTDILATRALSKSFGGLAAVSDVSLAVQQGQVHCLIGPNGAGKSTLFKLIVGTYAPSAGAVLFRGEDITAIRTAQRVRRGMSIKMQQPSIFRELPVRQNLRIALQYHVDPHRIGQEEDRLLELLGLAASAAIPAGTLSHGQQQWLEIGMAIALKPALLLLDEPTAGLSPEETERTGELILRMARDGMTVLVVEHDMAFVRQVAQQVTVLHLGKVFARGTVAEITADAQVAEIYLGKGHHAQH